MPADTAPSDEEYEVLLNGLRSAKTRLAQLQIASALEKAPSPNGTHLNLLSFLNKNLKDKSSEGSRLAYDLAGAEIHVNVIQGLLDKWNTAQAAWRDAQLEGAVYPIAEDPVDDEFTPAIS